MKKANDAKQTVDETKTRHLSSKDKAQGIMGIILLVGFAIFALEFRAGNIPSTQDVDDKPAVEQVAPQQDAVTTNTLFTADAPVVAPQTEVPQEVAVEQTATTK